MADLCTCDHAKDLHHFLADLVTSCSIIACPCKTFVARNVKLPTVLITTNEYTYLTLKVKLDRSGFGTFSTPESAREVVQSLLMHHIPHYEPRVELEL